MPVPCATDDSRHFSTSFRNDRNADLNDYGLLVEDAGEERCVTIARERLTQKIRSTFLLAGDRNEFGTTVGPFGAWLEGAHVALIFASAIEIYGRGQLTSALDEELTRVRNAYSFFLDPNCGLTGDRWRGHNTCMDDYSVAASAYGWIAAWERSRSRDVTYWREQADDALRRSLGEESVCLHRPDLDAISPCTASVADVMSGKAEALSLNHNQQSVHYGFGLMTSVSAAVLGLALADVGFEFTTDERVKALALINEAQRKTALDGLTFKYNCARNVRYENARWTSDHTGDCGETLSYGYRPGMYSLAYFYDRYIGARTQSCVDEGIEQPCFPFERFDRSLFSSSFLMFQNAGRRVTYGLLAYGWWVDSPPMPAAGTPLNDHRPLGYIDDIDGSGVATGWACDPDASSLSAKVTFRYSGSRKEIVSLHAAEGGEAAIASVCGSSPHRFRVLLPVETAGKGIEVVVHDVTSGELLPLGGRCSRGCSWSAAGP